MRARGFEFGAHGLWHDGRMFRSRHDFAEVATLVERLSPGEHHLHGFRGPSTCAMRVRSRRCRLITTPLSPTPIPYEPQPGGTCSLFPFFLSHMVELPYTLPQDHTLIHLLRRSPLPVWTMKAKWIASIGGMILTLTHPDYCGEGVYLQAYAELLKQLAEINSAWRALPFEVAGWWRQRAQLRLHVENGRPIISGPGAARASALRLSEQPLAN